MPRDPERGAPFPRAKKRPAPAHGIRVKQAGTTWWGERWLAALTVVLRGQAPRLARGRTYARAGRVHDLAVRRGKVTAKVTGTRATPYTVSIALRPLGAEEWSAALAALAARAQFAADLLRGVMPEAIDDAFAAAGTSLFPRTRAELETSCTCPDPVDPCKHVAATHTVLGEALDRDPFLLTELRGMPRDALIEALHAARRATRRAAGAHAGATPDASPDAASAPAVRPRARTRRPGPDAAVPAVAFRARTAEAYDRAPGPLPALRFAFDTPADPHDALLAQLGAPPGWPVDVSPVELLAPHVRAAADEARRLALGDEAPAAPASHEPAAPAAPDRVGPGAALPPSRLLGPGRPR